MLDENDMKLFMIGGYDCYENVLVEWINGILK